MSFELGLYCSIAYRAGEFTVCDRVKMVKKCVAHRTFLSFWNPKGVGAIRGTGWDVQVK